MTTRASPPLQDAALRDCVAQRFAPRYDLTSLLTNVNREHAEEDIDGARLRTLWRRHAGEDQRRSCRCILSCYLHIPFCMQKCAYCSYYSIPLTRPQWLASYLHSMRAQLAFFASAFSSRRFETLYIGGGTPSVLSPRQIEGLFDPLFARYSFCDAGERAFEFNPDSVDIEKLKTLERFGFNRISMGVQSFRPDVLERENRGYQTYAAVADAMSLILGRGRFVLNVDLLVGMQGDDRESFLNTLDAVLALDPHTVTAYPVKPTKPYLARHYQKQSQFFDADLVRRYGSMSEAVGSIAHKRGYRWSPQRLELQDNNWYFERKPVRRFDYVYDDLAPYPVSVFSLGPTARSRIAGGLIYHQTGAHDTVFRPQAPIWRGLRLDARWEMHKFVLREMMDSHAVSPERFQSLFGREIGAVYPQALRALRSARRIQERKDALAIIDPTPRRLFLAALYFLGRAELEGMSEVRFSLVTSKGRWQLSLRRLSPVEPCLGRVGNLALVFGKNRESLITPRVDDRLLRLVVAAFVSSAARQPNPSAAGVAPYFLGSLRAILSRLERTGRLAKGALRLRHAVSRRRTD